jgi:hypothetical protein
MRAHILSLGLAAFSFLTAKTPAVAAFGDHPVEKKGCTSNQQYGWPRFESLYELQADTNWARYFLLHYGELPMQDQYPVCIFDLLSINATAYNQSGLLGTRTIVSDQNAVKPGDLFVTRTVSAGLGIYHDMWKPVPNDTWVEVQHSVFPTELSGAWVWTLPGSGVWANVGKTLVFPTPSDIKKTHAEAIAFLTKGCTVKISNKWPQLESDIFGKCAREKGYDSIQFEPEDGQTPIGTFGITGFTEMVLVNLDGFQSCGVEDPTTTSLRQGWAASTQCRCTAQPTADGCGLMSKPPPPMIFEQPPLCKLRQESRLNSCTPATCKQWACDVS